MSMHYFLIETTWDEKLNSPWHALRPDKPSEVPECLSGSLPLAPIWNPPRVKLQKRKKQPEIYGFVLHFAITQKLRDCMAPVVLDEAEFLQLIVPDVDPLYVIHPLWPVDFDDRAELICNEVSGNITVVKKYSFTLNPMEYDRPRHLFCMRQVRGSAARDAGYTLNNLIVSEKIKSLMETMGHAGISFKLICAA